MTPLDLFFYCIAASLGLCVSSLILGAMFVFGGAILRRLTKE